MARYKPRMRRPTRLGLAILAALLLILSVYTAYWFIVAGRIEDSIVAWAQSARADNIEVSWQLMRVIGFPVDFRVELETAKLRDAALSPAPEIRVPTLSGTARPWDFSYWRLAADAGFTAELAGGGGRVPVKVTAQTTVGLVSIGPQDGWNLWLRLQDASVATADRVQVSSADTWVIIPPKPPREHTDPMMALAFNLRLVQLPSAIGPLRETIDELAFGATVKGAIPNGKLAQAAAAWRDTGGTIELDNLRFKWGGLGATATGTMALDQELQPIAAFSGAIQGYDQILTVLVQSGNMRPTDAGLARIALALLAKVGPDGKPEIKTAFTIQNGQMFLGPARLGKAPRITWE